MAGRPRRLRDRDLEFFRSKKPPPVVYTSAANSLCQLDPRLTISLCLADRWAWFSASIVYLFQYASQIREFYDNFLLWVCLIAVADLNPNLCRNAARQDVSPWLRERL